MGEEEEAAEEGDGTATTLGLREVAVVGIILGVDVALGGDITVVAAEAIVVAADVAAGDRTTTTTIEATITTETSAATVPATLPRMPP